MKKRVRGQPTQGLKALKTAVETQGVARVALELGRAPSTVLSWLRRERVPDKAKPLVARLRAVNRRKKIDKRKKFRRKSRKKTARLTPRAAYLLLRQVVERRGTTWVAEHLKVARRTVQAWLKSGVPRSRIELVLKLSKIDEEVNLEEFERRLKEYFASGKEEERVRKKKILLERVRSSKILFQQIVPTRLELIRFLKAEGHTKIKKIHSIKVINRQAQADGNFLQHIEGYSKKDKRRYLAYHVSNVEDEVANIWWARSDRIEHYRDQEEFIETYENFDVAIYKVTFYWETRD